MFFEGAFLLAGAPELEYSSFSLRLPEAELPRLLEALDAVPAPRLRAMQAAALRVRQDVRQRQQSPRQARGVEGSMEESKVAAREEELMAEPWAELDHTATDGQMLRALLQKVEHVETMIQAALKPLSPVRHQLSPEQVTLLYEQLNQTRAMIDACCTGLAQSRAHSPPVSVVSAAPSSVSTQRSFVAAREDGGAFASLVEAATAS